MRTERRRIYRAMAVTGVVVGLAAAVPFAAGAVVTPSEPRGATSAERAVDQADADAVRSAAGTTGAIVTVKDGDTVQSFGSGSTHRGQKDVPDGDDKFRIASNTKTYVATVLLQLVDEGKLNLDSPIGDHLPGLVKGEGIDENKITVRQLMQMTSGIADHATAEVIWDPSLQWFPPKPEQLVPLGTRHGALFEPGTDYQYSNTNYVVLGLLIEKLTGKEIGEAIDERIVQPLGLKETQYVRPGQKKIEGPHFGGYFDLGPVGLDVSGHEPGIWGASASMVSSGTDMTAFHSALVEGRLLSPQMLAEMQKTVPGDDGIEYGLGLFPAKTSCGTGWGHTGLVPGYVSFSFADGKGRAVFIGVNGHATDSEKFGKALNAVLAEGLCGSDSATAKFTNTLPDDLVKAIEKGRKGRR